MKRYWVDIEKSTLHMLNEIIEEVDGINTLSEAISICVTSVHDNLKSGTLSSLDELTPTQAKLNKILSILELLEADLV